jgi:hypothetical protein
MPTDQPVNEARTIERLPIDSSNLKAVGYDADRQILSVEFHPAAGNDQGSIFHYYNVPVVVFEDMGTAESRGRFYSQHIRGHYVAKPMTGKCPACGAIGFIAEHCGFCADGIVREIDRQHKEG